MHKLHLTGLRDVAFIQFDIKNCYQSITMELLCKSNKRNNIDIRRRPWYNYAFKKNSSFS